MPSHALLERLNLLERRPRDHRQRHVARGQVFNGAVEMIADIRAARTPFLPFRAEHEVVSEPLTAPGEQIGQRSFAAGSIEDVIPLDPLPRQLAALTRELVAIAGELLFFCKMRSTRFEPLVV